MEHLIRSLKIAWQSERLLKQNEFRLMIQKVQFSALAGLVAIFGLVMLSIAAYFALVPYWGQALSALTIGIIELVLAGLLITYAGRLQTSAEAEMVKEVRDMALGDVEEDLALAEAELITLKDEVHKFVRNPLDTLLPVAIGPLIAAITRGLNAAKK